MFDYFTNNNMTEVRALLEEKLQELKKEHGLNIEVGTIRYTRESFTAKISATLEDGKDLYELEFNRHWPAGYVNAIGTYVIVGDEKFKFRGFKPRARKNKAMIENMSGKLFRCEFDIIRTQL